MEENGLDWSGRHLWMLYWTCEFHKMRGICWLTENRLASQESWKTLGATIKKNNLFGTAIWCLGFFHILSLIHCMVQFVMEGDDFQVAASNSEQNFKAHFMLHRLHKFYLCINIKIVVLFMNNALRKYRLCLSYCFRYDLNVPHSCYFCYCLVYKRAGVFAIRILNFTCMVLVGHELHHQRQITRRCYHGLHMLIAHGLSKYLLHCFY